ncbi:MAG TPA: hypothetical protein VKB43_04790, partial [Gaiellaceae bacterium]|nr:hypothetical protein [Gaiellaceae bacterium]
RHPIYSAKLLLGDRPWLIGWAMESAGFLLYVAALALAPLSLVQAIGAGGIGVLAFVSAHRAGRSLTRTELGGVLLSVLGLVALAVSLLGGHAKQGGGEIGPILVWLGATVVVALVLVLVGRRRWGTAVAYGIAGGLFFSLGDISTAVTTQGGARVSFVALMLLGYGAGTALLQIGYQAGGALTVAGLATLVTNALPIAAGTVVLDEPLPGGALGTLRLAAFIAVVAGAVLLARQQPRTGAGHAPAGAEAPTRG